MSDSRDDEGLAIASDGLVARASGVWAKEKLSFLDEYLPPALIATRRKQQRHFVDLFAGPGINVGRSGGEEFEGGTLRAIKITDGTPQATSFTHVVGCDIGSEQHRALAARVARILERGQSQIPADHIRLIQGDANSHAAFIMKRIDPRAYVLVFADPTKPRQLPFSTIEALKQFGHVSVDLYVLYPNAMALRRLMGNPDANALVLTRFYGDEEWRRFAARRVTEAHLPEAMRGLRDHYMAKLKTLGWRSVRLQREIKRPDGASLYDMLFATDHPAGDGLGSWEARRQRQRDQTELF